MGFEKNVMKKYVFFKIKQGDKVFLYKGNKELKCVCVCVCVNDLPGVKVAAGVCFHESGRVAPRLSVIEAAS